MPKEKVSKTLICAYYAIVKLNYILFDNVKAVTQRRFWDPSKSIYCWNILHCCIQKHKNNII